VAPGRQIDPVLEEPQQRLADAAKLCDLVDDEADRVLTRRSGSFSSRSPTFRKPIGALTTSSPRRAFSCRAASER
jgi:hypothetical protein